MEIWELGRKIRDSLLPIGVFAGMLVWFNVNILTLILATFLFAIIYILVWHEIRLRKVEHKG